MRKIYGFTIMVGFIAMFAMAGEGDYQNQQGIEKRYCDMVKQGAWPAFRGECLA